MPGRSYGLDWYKKDGRVGVKLKHGKRNQLCSFGGAACKNEVSQEQLMAIGKELVDELTAGRVPETTAAARNFADDRIDALKKKPTGERPRHKIESSSPSSSTGGGNP